MNKEEICFYEEKGFFIAENLLTGEEVQILLDETTRIFRGAYDIPGVVRLPETASEEEVLKNYLCIHQPHKVSKLLEEVIRHPKIVVVLRQLIGENVQCMQSMLFVKPPGFPGQAWHQDEYYIPTEDRSLTGVWIALDDATIENGCLWVVPGSHKEQMYPVGPQPPGDEYDGVGLMCVGVKEDAAIPVELRRGSVLFFNGCLLHQSKKNRSNVYRRALVNHYMSADYPLRWCGEDPYRDVILVAGKDPFAHLGYRDIAKPHLRSVICGGKDS